MQKISQLANVFKKPSRKSSRIIRRLWRQTYSSARFYNNWLLERSGSDGRVKLLIYQMGKVGSTTVVRSLEPLQLPLHTS